MKITKSSLSRIVKRALREIADIPAGSGLRSVPAGSSAVKSTSRAHVLEDVRASARSAHGFAINTQRYKRLGPGTMTRTWNNLGPFTRELMGILAPELLAYAKGVSEDKSSKFESLLDYDDASNRERIEGLVDHTEQLVSNVSRYMSMFDELMEDSDGDSLEILARLDGVGSVQRERIKFLIDKHYGHKIHGRGTKKLSPEREQARAEMADAAKLRADIEDKKMQLLRQREMQVTQQSPPPSIGSAGATPPQGTRRPKA